MTNSITNENEIVSIINSSASLKELEDLRVKYLGKTGEITSLMKNLGSMNPEERKEYGAKINKIKENVASAIDYRKEILEKKEIEEKLASEKIDISLPGRNDISGSIHPISQTMDEITSILSYMGFERKDGPSIETDYYNFTALNIGEDHPARQMHDTFYIGSTDGDNMVLRTHTSSVQIRAMENGKPPFKIFSIGRTYRSDSDATHSPMFHQLELLWIDENINIGTLKYTVMEFIRKFFEKDDIKVRFRASFFPFTSPSAEVDVGFKDKWLEIFGCGMVHPDVLKNVGVDPEKYQGFACGMGIERLAMLKYGIDDLREFFAGDIRWLKHYNFDASDIPNIAWGLTK